MAVVAGDIVVYGAANQAEADGVTQGGVIDATTEYIFDVASAANTLNDTVNVISDSAADVSITLTVTGRNAGGSIVDEDFTITGATPVVGAVTFERILKVDLSGVVHTGNISLTGSTNGSGIATLPTGVFKVLRPFYNVAADSLGGSSRDFYEKVFVKNNNTVNSLLTANIVETGDPSGVITFALEDTINAQGDIADRLDTAPTGATAFGDGSLPVPGTDLGQGDAIGVWMKMTLPAGANATKTTWTMNVNGNTT